MPGLFKQLRNRKLKRSEILFLSLVVLVLSSSFCASLLQSDFGKVDITYISVVDEYGNKITGKMYRPKTATAENPAPGVITLHGMNNDKDTEAPVSMELARRGMVVIAVDQQNHGDSDIGMDVVGSYFGTAEENENDTIGANAVYEFLKNSEFVDGSRMGVIGHSMGGGTAETIARMHPDNMAVIIQAGPAVNMSTVLGMHNYLEIWTYYEELFITEMESRADYMARGKAMIEYNLDLIGETPRNDYVDENYGNFSEGTAQRYALCSCTHPGGTWNRKSIQESVAWMQQALMGELYSESLMLEAGQQYYQIKETLTLIALIAALISILPLASMLMDTKYFSELITPMSEKIPNPGGKWWKAATINTLIGGISFIFLPMIGMIGFGALTIVLPLFRLLTGNGSLLWLLVNAGICIILFNAWFKRNKEPLGLTLEDLGAFPRKKNDDQSRYLLKTFLLTVIVFGYLYILVTIIQSYFMVELRAMWPILKMFTPYRFGLFLLYLIPMYPFFKVNGGLFMFGQARMKPMKSPALTQLVWWLKYIFAMEAGLFLVFLIQYIPLFVFKTGPGLGFGMLQLLFGLFGIFSFQILPQFAIVFFITTYLFRKTGKIYVGAYIATMLATWIMAISGQLV